MKLYSVSLAPSDLESALLSIGIELPEGNLEVRGAYCRAGDGGKVEAIVVELGDPAAHGEPEELSVPPIS